MSGRKLWSFTMHLGIDGSSHLPTVSSSAIWERIGVTEIGWHCALVMMNVFWQLVVTLLLTEFLCYVRHCSCWLNSAVALLSSQFVAVDHVLLCPSPVQSYWRHYMQQVVSCSSTSQSLADWMHRVVLYSLAIYEYCFIIVFNLPGDRLKSLVRTVYE